MTMTRALTAGSSADHAALEADAANVRFARIAARPMPVIESARPALNATIRTQAERDSVERDRGEEDDERRRAGEEPA